MREEGRRTGEGDVDGAGGEMDVASRRFENHAVDCVCAEGEETERRRLRDVVLDQLPIDCVCEVETRIRNQPASFFVMITANRMFGSVGWATTFKRPMEPSMRITFTQPRSWISHRRISPSTA